MTPLFRKLGLAVVLGVGASVAMAEDTNVTVNVSLWDKGNMSMDKVMDGPMMGMRQGGDMSMVTMGITLDQTTVKGSDVTFVVTNTSTWLEHEMIVARLDDPNTPLPYDIDNMEVDEDAAGAIGEVPETEPGETGSVTLHLAPGTYILFCNIPGHYAMGMWTTITLTE